MHTAIIVVDIPVHSADRTSATEKWDNFILDVEHAERSNKDRLTNYEGVERLAVNVWQVNFEKQPHILARIVSCAVAHTFSYRILPLADEPQWILGDPNPKPNRAQNAGS